MADLTLVALGGNALIRPGQSGTLGEQAEALRLSLPVVVELARRSERVVITHGNGPQVGYALLRAELARGRAYDLPLDVCVAQTQAEIGYLIARELEPLLNRAGLRSEAAVVVTRTLVDRDDPLMRDPVKPIGPEVSAEEARQLRERGQTTVEVAGGRFRRVVPSPDPRAIVEIDAIRALVERGAVTIAAGGGGIPVAREDGRLEGVEAVVDKDLAGCVVALALGAARIIDLTSVDHAKLDFGSARERNLGYITADEARQYLDEGHFGAGTMHPKMEAAARFIEGGGTEFIITTPERAIAALDGETGTHVT